MKARGKRTERGGGLAGQVAVVTGAAHGIGLGIAARLLDLGANVVITDLNREAIEQSAADLRVTYPDRVVAHVGDLSRERTANALQALTVRRFGAAQILVNCAGGGVILPFLEHTPATLKATIDRNLWTTLWCTRVFLPAMVAAKYGRVINIGADSVRSGLVDHAGYNAAKGGVHAMTTGLAREFAASRITFNTVAPSAIRTAALVRFEKSDPKKAKRFLEVIPLGRAGEIAEVASMVGHLALPESGFITGQVISVNGGTTMP